MDIVGGRKSRLCRHLCRFHRLDTYKSVRQQAQKQRNQSNKADKAIPARIGRRNKLPLPCRRQKKIAPTEPEEMTKKESTTDSDCGLFVKGEHERCFAYSTQTACDRHGFVLDFELGAGNLHDGQMFHELYKKMELSKTEVVAVDAGYKTPGVVREIFKSGKIPAVPYTRPKTKDGFFRKSEYVYDEYFDCYLCPQNQILKYTTTNREGY